MLIKAAKSTATDAKPNVMKTIERPYLTYSSFCWIVDANETDASKAVRIWLRNTMTNKINTIQATRPKTAPMIFGGMAAGKSLVKFRNAALICLPHPSKCSLTDSGIQNQKRTHLLVVPIINMIMKIMNAQVAVFSTDNLNTSVSINTTPSAKTSDNPHLTKPASIGIVLRL
jgi:hypothetical protein